MAEKIQKNVEDKGSNEKIKVSSRDEGESEMEAEKQ